MLENVRGSRPIEIKSFYSFMYGITCKKIQISCVDGTCVWKRREKRRRKKQILFTHSHTFTLKALLSNVFDTKNEILENFQA